MLTVQLFCFCHENIPACTFRRWRGFIYIFVYISIYLFICLLVHISQSPASFSVHKMTRPVYPEVSIIPKDGGARSDGHSDAATKPAPVRLQAGPAAERGERPCCSGSLAVGQKRAGSQAAAEPSLTRAWTGDRCRLRRADGEKRERATQSAAHGAASAHARSPPVLFSRYSGAARGNHN